MKEINQGGQGNLQLLLQAVPLLNAQEGAVPSPETARLVTWRNRSFRSRSPCLNGILQSQPQSQPLPLCVKDLKQAMDRNNQNLFLVGTGFQGTPTSCSDEVSSSACAVAFAIAFSTKASVAHCNTEQKNC